MVKKLTEDGGEEAWEYVHPVIDASKGKLARQYGRVNKNYQDVKTEVDYDY